MLQAAVKFCGGCNPRYDRGDAFHTIRAALVEQVSFSYAKEGERYDLLLIIRGCSGCPYLYEEIDAAHRVVLAEEAEINAALQDIQKICRESAEGG